MQRVSKEAAILLPSVFSPFSRMTFDNSRDSCTGQKSVSEGSNGTARRCIVYQECFVQ